MLAVVQVFLPLQNRILTGSFPRSSRATVDLTILGFAFILSLVVAGPLNGTPCVYRTRETLTL